MKKYKKLLGIVALTVSHSICLAQVLDNVACGVDHSFFTQPAVTCTDNSQIFNEYFKLKESHIPS